MPAIITRDKNGNVNGTLIPIWNANDEPGLRPEQVYATMVLPGCTKGPHLHMKRRGMFCCIVGTVEVVIGDAPIPKNYTRTTLTPDSGLLIVPAGCPAEIRNAGAFPAVLLNLPSPAWSKEDPDDHPVPIWNPPPCGPLPTER